MQRYPQRRSVEGACLSSLSRGACLGRDAYFGNLRHGQRRRRLDRISRQHKSGRGKGRSRSEEEGCDRKLHGSLDEVMRVRGRRKAEMGQGGGCNCSFVWFHQQQSSAGSTSRKAAGGCGDPQIHHKRASPDHSMFSSFHFFMFQRFILIRFYSRFHLLKPMLDFAQLKQ